MNTKPQGRFTIEQVRLLSVILTAVNLILFLLVSISKPRMPLGIVPESSGPEGAVIAIVFGTLTVLATGLNASAPFLRSRGLRLAAAIVGAVIWSNFGLLVLCSSNGYGILIPLRLASGVWLLSSTAGFISLVHSIRNARPRPPAGRCQHCGYSTIGLTSDFCPECGARSDPQ